jgi:5-methylcytosine-specific restriction endonuclease McrA
MTYQESLKHEKWIKKRNKVFSRDNHKCVLCTSKQNLQVHHLYYFQDNVALAWQYPYEALITVCKSCHEKIHANPKHRYHPYTRYDENWIQLQHKS